MVRPNGQLIALRSEKLTLLLAYLWLHIGQPIDREWLAGLLWPQGAPASARRNLREYLYRARQLLTELGLGSDALVADDAQVTLQLPNPDSCWIDVRLFDEHRNSAASATHIAQRIHHWRIAWDLYRGDLLAGIYEDWVLEAREERRRQAIEVLEFLSESLWEVGQGEQAVVVLREAVTFAPDHDRFWRRLIEMLYQSGDRVGAVRQYQRYETWLREEFDLEPDEDMQALSRLIQQETAPHVQRPFVPDTSSVVISGHSTSGVAFRPPFVGRRSELLRLHLTFSDRPHGTVDTMVITGANGVGKTRLIQEWRKEIAGKARVLEGRGYEFDQEIPYLPLLDAIQPALEFVSWERLPPAAHAWLAPLAQLLPDLYFYLPDLPSEVTPTDSDTAHYVMEGLAQLMLALVREQPLVLLIDDLHWADRSTWHFLPFISRRMRGKPFLVVAAFSTTDADAEARSRLRALQRGPHVQVLPLAHLWPTDIARLVPEAIRSHVVSLDAFSTRLHQLTQGNPFFATEILRALLESDLPQPYTAASLDQLRLPSAVQTLIQARLDRLAPESRQALCMAATIGREFNVRLLQEITGLEEDTLLGFLDEWLRRGLVVEVPGGYDFSQQQIREVAYFSQSRSRRRRVHRRVAEALSHLFPGNIERVTRHYALSDQPELAIPGLLTNGQRALNLRAYREAELIGQTLLDILQKTPQAANDQDRLALNIQLALAYAFRGETARALALLEEAAAYAEVMAEAFVAAEALLRIAQIHWLRGDALRCRPYAERSLQALDRYPGNAPDLRAAALRLLGRVSIAQGRFAEAAWHLERALALLGDTRHQLHRVTTQGYLITAYGRLGRVKAVRELARNLDVVTRQLESPALRGVIAVQVAVAFNALDLCEEARYWAEAGLQLCQEQELPVYVFVAKTVLGRVMYRSGAQGRGKMMLQDALSWAEAKDYWLFRFMALVFLAEIAWQEKDCTALSQLLRATEEAAARTGNAWALAKVRTWFNELEAN